MAAGPVSKASGSIACCCANQTASTLGLQGLSAEDLAALLAQVSLHSVEAQLPFDGSQTPARRTPARPRRSRPAAAVAGGSESSDEDEQVGAWIKGSSLSQLSTGSSRAAGMAAMVAAVMVAAAGWVSMAEAAD